MVEIEGKIQNNYIFVLIDIRSSLSYICPTIIEKHKLPKDKHRKYWTFQLAIGTNHKVLEIVKNCSIKMDEMETQVNLNILPLGSYDILIGMDWMEKHKAIPNYFDETFTCVDDKGKFEQFYWHSGENFYAINFCNLIKEKWQGRLDKLYVVHILNATN